MTDVIESQVFADNVELSEPYTNEEGYLVYSNAAGSPVYHLVEDWADGAVPNVIQQAILDTREHIGHALSDFLAYGRNPDFTSNLIQGAFGEPDDCVWGEKAPALEEQGHKILQLLQHARLLLDQACLHLKAAARIERGDI